MNRKTKLKSTLDNLFTSTRVPPAKTEEKPEVSLKQPEKKAEKKAAAPAAPTTMEKKPPVGGTTRRKKATAAEEKQPKTGAGLVGPIPAPEPESKPNLAETVEIGGVNLPGGDADSPPVVEKATPLPAAESEEGRLTEIPASQPPATLLGPVAVPKSRIEEMVPPATAAGTRPAEKRGAKTIDQHVVVFTLGEESYAVGIQVVDGIIKMQPITIVPHTQDFIRGVTNLRGKVVPVVNLRRRFGLPSQEDTPDTRIIIITLEREKIGIVVDEVKEVIKISADSVDPTPAIATTVDAAFISGIAKLETGLVIQLDMVKILG